MSISYTSYSCSVQLETVEINFKNSKQTKNQIAYRRYRAEGSVSGSYSQATLFSFIFL